MWSSHSYVQIEGELSFDVQILNDVDGRGPTAVNNTRSKDEVEADLREGAGDGRVTAGAILECEYQYPERQQLQALLSDMMNQLAQVIITCWLLHTMISNPLFAPRCSYLYELMTHEY